MCTIFLYSSKCIGIGLFDYINDSMPVIQKMGACDRDVVARK